MKPIVLNGEGSPVFGVEPSDALVALTPQNLETLKLALSIVVNTVAATYRNSGQFLSEARKLHQEFTEAQY